MALQYRKGRSCDEVVAEGSKECMRMQIIHARAYTHEAQVGEYCALLCSARKSLSRSYQHIMISPLLCPVAAFVVA